MDPKTSTWSMINLIVKVVIEEMSMRRKATLRCDGVPVIPNKEKHGGFLVYCASPGQIG